MAIQIQRDRQFMGDPAGPLPLFEADGSLGGYLRAAARKISDQGNVVKLQGPQGELRLDTAAAWDAFFAEHTPDRERSAKFKERFGISFLGFTNILDDLAMSDDRGVEVDLGPQSPLSLGLDLAAETDHYAAKLRTGDKIDLVGPVATSAEARRTLFLGPDLLANPITSSWQRDRAEQEAWGDFVVTGRSWDRFRDNVGAKPFEKLSKPDWKDPEAMALVARYNFPLHLEETTGADGQRRFQDRNENFREIYFHDTDGIMDKLGISLRLRVRFDRKDPAPGAPPDAPVEYEIRRVLIQVKESREVDPATGQSVVHKMEERYSVSKDEMEYLDAVLSGKDPTGKPVPVMQKLYKLIQDSGLMPPSGELHLVAESLVLQKRRRTHLQLEGVDTVEQRLTAATKEKQDLTAASQPVPEALQTFITKLEGQVKTMKETGAILQKYQQWMPQGEAFIISADRYAVYDPNARGGKLPTELGDELGRVGRGLHVEAEWDAASSDPFQKAITEIEKRLSATPAPANAAELEADKVALQSFSALMRQDVMTTEKLQEERLLAAGLRLDPHKASKEERAHDFMANRNNVARYWHS